MAFELDKPVTLRSGCKINLSLEITGVRPDGYHTLKSYFLPLHPLPFSDELADTLLLKPLQRPGGVPLCLVRSNLPGLDPLNNTLTKAFGLFSGALPGCPSLDIELRKGVPAGAGLGGGSANAAALLVFLNNLAQAGGVNAFAEDELLALAALVGADVPFFILNRPAWVSGIGELVRPDSAPLEAHKNSYIILLCPNIHISTPWAFAEWDKLPKPEQNALTSEGRRDSNNSAAEISFINSLENPVFAAFPALHELKEKLLALGAYQAMMSGSGSSLFGLFADKEAAEAAVAALRNEGLALYARALCTGASPSW